MAVYFQNVNLVEDVMVVKFPPEPRPVKVIDRSSLPEVFLGKGDLKICNKFTG